MILRKKAIITILVVGVLVAFSLLTTLYLNKEKQDKNAILVVGSDKDHQGCIGSAGYVWCSLLKKCVRPWEIANDLSFENNLENFNIFCNN